LAGMIVSNEPGYYENNNFGIRIENLLEIVEKKELESFGGKGFLGFEKLTKIPIQKKLIKTELLTSFEIDWLNKYHEDIFEKVFPLLKTDRAREWLKLSTSPIVV
jgi:Xaa-Pro aminopeptidase